MICETCCQVELEGGMGAPDTLREMVRKTGKSAVEIHTICVKCPHGGPGLEEAPNLLTVRGSDGKYHKSGPEFEAHDQEFKEAWYEKLERLKNES